MAQINKPTDYFNTVLYTGNGSTQSITGVGFQPDWVWIKARSATRDHNLYDSVRGATKWLDSQQTLAEDTFTNGLTSFDSDGFSVGDLIKSNNNSETYASWNWLASNTTASNTDGSITSTVSANTTSGFSIVSYTGTGSTATVGHGLGVTPKMIITKNRSSVETWRPYHVALGAGQALALNDVNATDTDAAYWSNTAPTSSVFTVGTTAGTNGSGNSMIAYCFAEVKGFSKFGSYIGNGNADGTFIYTGFKPAFVIFKKTSAVGNWAMLDSTRSYANVANHTLATNSSNAESSFGGGESVFGASNKVDIVSNGIKIREASDYNNASGATFIYMAFAEEPLVGDNPATAR